MEIQFFHERVTEKDPKRLIDSIQRMASGKAPFFPETLSLIFDRLVEKAFTKRTIFGPGPGGCTAGESQNFTPTPPPQASTSTSSALSLPIVDTVASSSNLQAPASTYGPVPPITTPNSAWLKCVKCGQVARLRDLRKGLRCPKCPKAKNNPPPLMQCTSCNKVRGSRVQGECGKKCKKRFM